MNIGAKGAASLVLTGECPFFSQNRGVLSIQNSVVTVYWLIMLQYSTEVHEETDADCLIKTQCEQNIYMP